MRTFQKAMMPVSQEKWGLRERVASLHRNPDKWHNISQESGEDWHREGFGVIGLSEIHIQAVRQHGVRTFPFECVGVLLGDVEGEVKIVREVRELPNTFAPSEDFERSVASDAEEVTLHGQERRFQIAPDAMFSLMQEERRTGRKILGFYHSHPNHPAQPSAYDREWAAPWYTYIIVSIMNGEPAELTAWQLEEDRQAFGPETMHIGQD